MDNGTPTAAPASSLADFIASHRIFVSRVFAAGFFGLLLVTGSRLEGSIFAVVLFFLGLALVGVATIGRLWCSLYINGYKNTSLITVGPYLPIHAMKKAMKIADAT